MHGRNHLTQKEVVAFSYVYQLRIGRVEVDFSYTSPRGCATYFACLKFKLALTPR